MATALRYRDDDAPADAGADIVLNARRIIMTTRDSIRHLARRSSRRRPGGVSSSPVAASRGNAPGDAPACRC
jgi:hypothetical protein